MKFMIHACQITPTQNIQFQQRATSLDEITRALPDGYYSTFRTFENCTRVLGLTSHLRRLYDPVSDPEVEEPLLRRQVFALLEPFRPGEARVRLIMTKHGQTYFAAEPLKLLSSDIYEHGVHVETTELHRDHPRLKSTAFIATSDAERKHIAQQRIFEALLVKDGKILEGMTSNFFHVRNGVLSTPQYGILLGITRQTVLDVARGRGVGIKYEALALDNIATIDEAFITSSSRGIVPVVRIDEITIGQGMPGPVTKQLSSAYNLFVIKGAEKIISADE